MTQFKKFFEKITDAIAEVKREKAIKASYNTHLAELEESLIKKENIFEDKVKNEGTKFEDIAKAYEQIAFVKDSIKLAKEAYEYLFEKETPAGK